MSTDPPPNDPSLSKVLDALLNASSQPSEPEKPPDAARVFRRPDLPAASSNAPQSGPPGRAESEPAPQWYVLFDGVQAGPFFVIDLIQRAQSGQITHTTPVSVVGGPSLKWVEAGSFHF